MQPVANPYEADVVFCRAENSTRLLNEPWRSPKRPLFVLIEDHDAATMWVPTSVIQEPRTIAAIKHYSWKGYGGMCELQHWGRPMYRHVELLRLLEGGADLGAAASGAFSAAEHIIKESGCPTWPVELQRKFTVATPSWLTVRRGAMFPNLTDIFPIRKRWVDVAFSGTLNYGDFGENEAWQQQISRYRATFFKKLRQVCQHHKWRVEIYESALTKVEFYDLLRHTKIFVSPWGLGEWSGKDEEAILSGAILLKPGASFFESGIPMYNPGETCLDARPDGKDLDAVLTAALAKSNVKNLQKMQEHAHKVQSEFISYGRAVKQPLVVAQWADLVRRIKVALDAPG